MFRKLLHAAIQIDLCVSMSIGQRQLTFPNHINRQVYSGTLKIYTTNKSLLITPETNTGN